MSLPRLDHATHIADQLNVLAAIVKTRSRASLTDANHILETISARFFNALLGWNLTNLNAELANYPAADLGDRQRRIAIQVTNADGSDKIEHTRAKAVEHGLGTDFNRLIIFFLLPKKPGFPRNFSQPPEGPKIETWDITDLLKESQERELDVLARAAKVLDEELGKIAPVDCEPKFDISRITKYAPAELIGREEETKLLNDAWEKVLRIEKGRPHVLTFVALGGEGKTSLVANWAAELAAQDWPGCDAAFAWSFYSQGTREQVAASSDLFLKEALTFFGDDADKAFAASPAGAFEKGQRLARLVGQRRSLLILDGLEPLQYAPTSPTPGQLKDQGIAALLKGLAAASHGLCVVTTRYSLPDLKAFWQATAPEMKLLRLSRVAGVHLLQSFEVKGSLLRNIPFHRELVNEFEKLVEDVQGHALTLNLLGTYLRDAHAGDIRKRDLVRLEEADAEEQGGHAFRVMEAYELEFEREGDKGQRALAVLRLLGLFDRPLASDCLGVLLEAPAILELTEPLVGLTEAQRNLVFKRLEDARLLTVNRDASGALISLDAHPLLREYFARQLRAQHPEAWRAAHGRLYEHLCATTQEGDEPTLEDLQPLYQAVAHGCQAGLQQEACDEVYIARILRGKVNIDYYSMKMLGALSSDLGAIACFFEPPWSYVSTALSDDARSWLKSEASHRLRGVNRLSEALELIRAASKDAIHMEHWNNACRYTNNLSELELVLGMITRAVDSAECARTYAERSGDEYLRACILTTCADALHQAGQTEQAKKNFHDAESQSDYPPIFGPAGFRNNNLRLTESERNAWRTFLNGERHHYISGQIDYPAGKFSETKALASSAADDAIQSCRAVSEQATQTLIAFEKSGGSRLILEIALGHLAVGRAVLYETILNPSRSGLIESCTAVDMALIEFRRANRSDYLPHGLLTRAMLRFLTGARTGPESAQADLDEAWEIAERGPMKLFLADIHLYRARLFGRMKDEGGRMKYPWESPEADLAAAEKLINDCGYHRRDEELADAKAALLAM
jgi:hypothetical protein